MEYAVLNNGIKMPMEGFGVFQVPSAAGFREKLIGVHQGDPGEFIPLPDLERRVLEEIAGTLSGGGKEVELWR